MLFVAFIAMIVLGPEKLPEIARKVGKVMGELRRVSDGFQQELRQAVNDTTGASTIREVTNSSTATAALAKISEADADAPLADEPADVVVARGADTSDDDSNSPAS